MIHSAFRPSDDACIFPYLVPSNAFAVHELRNLSEICSVELRDKDVARQCTELADEVNAALTSYALSSHPKYGPIWPYEVDGFGNALLMDDANVPSLLSLPYLGCCDVSDPTYKSTRAFVLSEHNPYFFSGAAAEGVGGPHVGLDMVWPLGITIRALTSSDEQEILHCLKMLKATHAGTGFMHEAFHKDDPKRFTRKWFAWANTLFGELIVKLHTEKPHLLNRDL
jgi:meiotically up-regulated gene 157 (Mug157) protein